MPGNPLTRFSNRVADYVRYRPSYPEAFYQMLRGELGIGPESIVADIGSGPGISARPLLERGVIVHCVEPNREMRSAAEQWLQAYAGFRSIDASAESTSLADASVDLILCAQAFHWFDRGRARREFARILRPAGRVALVWNERRPEATPFLAEYESLLQRFAIDYQQVRHENVNDAALREFFAGPFERRRFDNFQDFDFDGLAGRVRSSSYTPAAGHPRFEPMMAALRELFDRHAVNGCVRFDYDTRAYVAPIHRDGTK